MRLSVSNIDVNRAKRDAQAVDEETRLKRQMKKIESNVSVLKEMILLKILSDLTCQHFRFTDRSLPKFVFT